MRTPVPLVLAATLAGCSQLVGCTALPPPLARVDQPNTRGVGETHDMIVPPRSLPDLLANLKIGLKANSFLRSDFYTERNLEAISGGNKAHLEEGIPNKQTAWATGFSQMISPMHVHEFTLDGMVYEIGRSVLPSGGTEAFAHVLFRESRPELRFERVEKIFGRDWVDDPLHTIQSERIFSPPSHPRGNARIRFQLDDTRDSRSIILEFFADGNLFTADFYEASK